MRTLDATDIKILNILQENADLDIKQIAGMIDKSISPTHQRIKNLYKDGFIKKSVAVLDPQKIGRGTLMVTQVRLNVHASEGIVAFAEAVNAFPEVNTCLHLSGKYDFLLLVSFRSPQEYNQFLKHKLAVLPGVAKVQSSLILEEFKANGPYIVEP
ncbi:Lrp/AsnC family transcriptional regulator [Mucilaginibacter corticis]|uniref:Lrp/AsnC family transcriptional regulator n=1 Tax=Mucilaginibacter corticis TaxID=2597670 RepID=A0A556MIP8_9SPHI|nr:Lrp/AsnC family transcriptional regulator [Mucilaginibacter corticis]TSJ39695.1 Lrp/AsnC family transcriptional regulator [Mucilaginibacter corticis]